MDVKMYKINVLLFLLIAPLGLFASPKVLFVNAFHFSQLKQDILVENCRERDISMEYTKIKKIEDDGNSTIFDGYDLVILNASNSDQSKKVYGPHLKTLQNSTTPYLVLNVLDEDDRWRSGVGQEQHQAIHEYIENGGAKNLSRFADYLAHELFKQSETAAKKPIIYPKTAIYHPDSPDKMFGSLPEYLDFLGVDTKDRSVIAIAMYQSDIGSVDTALIDETIRKLSQRSHLIPVAFYYEYKFGEDKRGVPFKELLSLDGEFRADGMIFYKMMHQAQKRRKEFEKLGIPIFGGLNYREGDTKAYEADKRGVSSFMVPFTLSIPETAGVINPMIVTSKDRDDSSKQVIAYQLDALIERVDNYMTLQTKANDKKRLAFFFWNYPSGQNAMGASFLNVPESLSSTFKRLKEHGYRTEDVNASYFTHRVKDMMALWYRDVNATELERRDLCEFYPLERYNTWFSTLPEYKQQEINAVWGSPEASNMLTKRDGKEYFTIPRMKVGNLVVLPQGSRSQDKKDEQDSYHNMAIPVNHGYLAVYLYVKEIFGVDAILHMGTHGSQEWMRGKERGLSVFDSPNLAVGDIPVIYPFIVDDIGEAMQTKRRGSAVSLSHLTPPFSPAGLHDELVELHGLMHQYNEMITGRTKEKTKEQIITLTTEQGFDKEIEADPLTEFSAYLEELHMYLDELSQTNQPLGMHTYGERLREEHAILTVMQMLGPDFEKKANALELGHEHHDHHGHHEEEGDESDIKSYEEVDSSNPYLLVKDAIDGEIYDDKELIPYLEDAQKYHKDIIGTREFENLLKALEGRYISTSTGGDPIRNPAILPTGRNMYGFDPSKVPTKAAYETGKELTQELIANYYVRHGVYPDKLAFSLWSIETMRHYGVLEAQILYALGIKPVWAEGGRVTGMQVIPFSELRRPRVDVVISATGLYRDAFPNVMEYLDEAIKKIVALKEEGNFVRSNALTLEKELLKEGLDEEKAKALSSIRIFSNASGTYGAGLAEKVMASGSWEMDADMSEAYMDRTGLAFGSGVWGEKVAERLYRKNLKGTDAAMFSRSSNVYGLLTSDDPFQYLGGIAQAVRNIDGKSPELFISDLRDKDKGKVEDIQRFMSKELRTRYLHPQWIKAMQEEGFSGASEIVGVVQNAWGWEVMEPTSLRDDQWQEFVEVYVNDKYELDMKTFFEQNNPDALAKISERFLEAIRKGYFKTDEKTLKRLVETYMEMANRHDVYTDNEVFKTFVKAKAVGYGLSGALPVKMQTEFDTMPTLSESAPEIKGQALEEVKSASQQKPDYPYAMVVLALIILAGAMYERSRSDVSHR